VSLERLVSGPGLMNIFQVHAAIAGRSTDDATAAALWERALSGKDPEAASALGQFCRAFGSAAGDIALIQGATAVVLAGGIGLRLAEHLPTSDFAARFAAKGRFADHMAMIPVLVLTHPEPGLYGAACAYARRRPQG
jgi:glucokinase